MINKTVKLVSVKPLDEKTKSKIKDIFATAKNPNQVLLDNVPEYAFMQGDVLYFTNLRTVNPNIEELQVSVLE